MKNIKTENSYEKIPLSLVLGGAIGNAIDRVFVLIPGSGYSGVIDFIDMPNLLYFILQYANDKKNEKSERIS